MADPTDPLSAATRAIKRNLLVASVLAIAANAFKVTIEKVSVAGLAISFDDRLFGFLLFVVLVYFLCTFVIYYTIDIKNFSKTTHQTQAEKDYNQKRVTFAARYGRLMQADLSKLVPVGYELRIPSSYPGALAKSVHLPEPTYSLTKIHDVPLPPGQQPAKMERNEETETFFWALDARMRLLIGRFRAAEARDKFKARQVLNLVRLMYRVRNYFIDGALPVVLGVIALAAIFGFINLHWLQGLFPKLHVIG